MFKYGILSTASIIDRFVAGIRESKDGHVQALASRTLDNAKKAAKRLDINNYYGNYEELYKDNDIDIIYIPTVNGYHYRDCKNALKHHKHVIVEKPFTLSIQDAKELFDLAKNNNCFLMEAQKAVFLPSTNKVKQLIDNKIIGELKYIEFKAGFPGKYDYDHWMYNLSLGGGTLNASATYTIEYLQFLFNQPHLQIDGSCIKSPTGTDEICNFQLKVNNSILVSSTIAMNVNLINEAVFYGELGYIVVPYYWKSNQLDLYLYNGEHQHFDFSYQSEFVYEIEHIHNCLKNNLIESPIMNKEKTFETIELVNQLQQKWQ
ncbi:Gfo/Idh/MocA family protein [Thomasclavelia cocleata]|uniref:Gfo/Idh/MocA family protein n=1 Tax=Thomasclavelia cocleata TaxID=69824 RepID=UPI0024305842|nr:Gfo/Idh/MocA family oxidoreductase [Thomasclavelia cocleata]MCI9131491.1 Gfo/Idh/MocA family oxidoreductase [Thomasclavelia cocleata]